jgi:glutamyl-tRNA reductase
MKDILMIGCGAMGRSVLEALRNEAQARVRYVLERPSRAGKLQDELGGIQVLRSLDELDTVPDLPAHIAEAFQAIADPTSTSSSVKPLMDDVRWRRSPSSEARVLVRASRLIGAAEHYPSARGNGMLPAAQ